MLDIVVAHKSSCANDLLLQRFLASAQVAFSHLISTENVRPPTVIIVTNAPDYCFQCIADNPVLNASIVPDLHPSGVYAAYLLGFGHVTMPYCMFAGCDDVLLASGLIAVSKAIHHNEPLLILSPTLHEYRGIRPNSPSRLQLVFSNWCQQSVVYCSKVLVGCHPLFELSYAIQADHDLHIRLLGSIPRSRIQLTPCPIFMFGADGISSMHVDHCFKAAMHSVVLENFGLAFYLLSMLRGLLGAARRRLRTLL